MKGTPSHCFWLAFIQFEAEAGENFNELIELNENNFDLTYVGAWANVLVDSTSLKDALEIIKQGLHELKFQLIAIQKIENTTPLIKEDELKSSVIDEIELMQEHGYRFMISDSIFPYTAEE